MENKIVRECVQGLIDDSKMIDELCEKTQTERINLVKVVSDLDSSLFGLSHIEKIKDIIEKLRDAQRKAQDAQSSAEEAKSNADYAVDDANEAEYACDTAMNMCKDLLDEMKQDKEEKETITTN